MQVPHQDAVCTYTCAVHAHVLHVHVHVHVNALNNMNE